MRRCSATGCKLRFTQRQMMMSAVALGGRVLTLTGRMSVFRADLATNPELHRLGRAGLSSTTGAWAGSKFLTGDDKSTWFWLLKNGYEMAYLPDVACVSMETQPKPGFVESAVTLMRPLVRQHAAHQRPGARAVAGQDRAVHLVVDPRPARVDVDDACRHRSALSCVSHSSSIR